MEEGIDGLGFDEKRGALVGTKSAVKQLEKTILIVDDDLEIRRGVGARLERSGYQTCFATDGVEAAKIAVDTVPDLVVLDLGISSGDGETVLVRLSDHPATKKIPIVAVSGKLIPAVRARAFDNGARAFIEKPFEGDELLRTIEDLLL